MKDSGIEWIGEIPEGWEIATLRHCIASIESGTSVNAGYYPAEENEYGVLKTSCVYNDNFNYNENKSVNYDEYERVKCPVKKHCLIISRMNTPDLVGSCGYTKSSYQNIFLPDRLWQVSFLEKFYYKFIYYFFASHATKIYISSHATGTSGSMKNISQKQLVNTPFVFPPFSEQERIADYLDAKCAHIDHCLELTRQSMEKLRAYKLSCITEAVTKGLDPDVSLKDSGVPWIGQIPTGWETMRLKFLLASPLQYGANVSGIQYNENSPRYIRITDIDENGGLRTDNKQSISENDARDYILSDGDILLARSGATVGKSFLYYKKLGYAAFAGYLIRAKANHKILNNKFLYYITLSYYYNEWKNSFFIQSTIQNIGADKYSNLPIVVPSIIEQKYIISYLDKKCARIDALLEEKQALLDKLAEYKKSLIFECVTGKREVPSCWNR